MIEGQEDVSWDDWRALADGCERHGIHALFRSDHYLSVSGAEERGSLDAWTTLAALGAVTSTVRLGTMVSPATFRHPSVLAKAVVTADYVSGGRVDLGIGTGWMEAEHTAYGFPFASFGELRGMLEEQIQVILGEWGEGSFSFEGDHYRIADLDARPKPVQKPHPPLILGGRGGPRSLETAARYADEYNTVYKSVDELCEIRAGLDAACEGVGREPIPLSMMTGWLVADDRAELVDRAARLAEWEGQAADGEAFLAGANAAWVVGTADEAAEQLDALRAVGVERIMAQHLLHTDVDALALIGRLSD